MIGQNGVIVKSIDSKRSKIKSIDNNRIIVKSIDSKRSIVKRIRKILENFGIGVMQIGTTYKVR